MLNMHFKNQTSRCLALKEKNYKAGNYVMTKEEQFLFLLLNANEALALDKVSLSLRETLRLQI